MFTTKDQFEEFIKSEISKQGLKLENFYFPEDLSWGTVVCSSDPDVLYEVEKSWLILFINGKPEKTGYLYSRHFSGEDFYFRENKLKKVLSHEKDSDAIKITVLKEDEKEITLGFRIQS